MANSQKEVDWGKTILGFNGHEYQLATLLKLAATGPRIDVYLGEIDLDPVGELSPVLKPNNQEIHEENLVLFKHNSKYIVLAGRNHVQRAKTNKLNSVSGSLISTPALKKSRIVKDVLQPATASTAMANAWPTSKTYDRGNYRKPNDGPSRYR